MVETWPHFCDGCGKEDHCYCTVCDQCMDCCPVKMLDAGGQIFRTKEALADHQARVDERKASTGLNGVGRV